MSGESGAAHIAPLTSLRAFAALLVVALHTKRQYGPGLAIEQHTAVFSKGYLGVDFFFVLSGFIIAYVYRDELRRFAWRPYLRFLANRVARLWPLHAATLALSAGYLLAVHGVLSLRGVDAANAGALVAALLANLTLTNNWFGDLSAHWNPPAWSVSCEWFAYLLLPAALALAPPGRGALRPAAALAGLVALLWATSPWTIMGGIGFGLPRIAIEFLMGVQLFRLYEVLDRRDWRYDAAAAASAAALLTALHFGHRVPDALLVAGFAAIILLAALSRGRFRAVLSTPALIYLGEISYAIYMSHWLVGRMIWPDLSALLSLEALAPAAAAAAWLATLASICALSALLHACVERPGRRWLRARLDPASWRRPGRASPVERTP